MVQYYTLTEDLGEKRISLHSVSVFTINTMSSNREFPTILIISVNNLKHSIRHDLMFLLTFFLFSNVASSGFCSVFHETHTAHLSIFYGMFDASHFTTALSTYFSHF